MKTVNLILSYNILSYLPATPSAATLTCVASFPGSVMDLDANGGILVLADMTNAMHPKYYCAVSIYQTHLKNPIMHFEKVP